MTVVVAGGAGTLGRLVLTELQAAHQPVRALVRDATAARQVLGGDVEIVAGDVREPATLGPALAGASVVVSAVHGFLGGRGDGPQAVAGKGTPTLSTPPARPRPTSSSSPSSAPSPTAPWTCSG